MAAAPWAWLDWAWESPAEPAPVMHGSFETTSGAAAVTPLLTGTLSG